MASSEVEEQSVSLSKDQSTRINVKSSNAKSMTSKGQVSSILFFYMFNAILTSIIDLICEKISFKKF